MDWDTAAHASGVIGMLLGIANTLMAFNSNRVRAKSRLVIYSMADGVPESYRFEVINLSQFPVVLAEYGFIAEGSREQICMCGDETLTGVLPHTIEPRAAFASRPLPAGDGDHVFRAALLYARFQCGKPIRSKDPLIHQLKLARARREKLNQP